MTTFVRTCNALLILVLMGVILSAFYQEFTVQGNPCPLCLLQRIAMVGVATSTMMNLRFGIRIRHYALGLASAVFGASVSVRQILLHICPSFSEFGYPVLGYSLFTWAFFVFCSCVVAIIIFLFLYKPEQRKTVQMNGFEKFTFAVLALIVLVNLLIAFSLCGFGSCPDPSWPPK